MKRVVLLLGLAAAAFTTFADTPLVAVASNMTHVMKDIAEKYGESKGKNVRLTFGSSGNFTRQIQQGAPYRVFLSAAENYVHILQEKQLLAEPPRAYVTGRIGFFIPENSSLDQATNLTEVFNHLYYGDYRRIAIANPEHAPYGIAAGQVLQNAGFWAVPAQRLMVAENAAQVVQYVLSGGVDAGLIPHSFADLPVVRNNGRYLPVPENLHEPITHYLALLKGAGPSERDFYTYLAGETAQSLLLRSGYSMADDR